MAAPRVAAKRVKRNAPPRPRVSPYLDMVSRPDTTSSLLGYPDGSQEPSFTYRHRQIITLSPSTSGALTFAIVPHVGGSIMVPSIGPGWSASIRRQGASGTYNESTAPFNRIASATQGNNQVILPYNEFNSPTVYAGTKGSLQFSPSKFRILAQKAKVSYTGSTLTDSGSVVVARTNIAPDVTLGTSTATVNGNVASTYLVNTTPVSQSALYSSGTAKSFCARQQLASHYVNTVPRFQEMNDYALIKDTTGVTYSIAAANTAGTDLAPGWAYSFDASMPSAVYAYSGLDPTSSITVEVVTLIEYAVPTTSVLSGLSRSNPPREPGTDSLLQKLWANAPSAHTVADAAVFVSRAFLGRSRATPALRDEF